MEEVPFETYERMTGEKWPGGNSKIIRLWLKVFQITETAASAEANLKLQTCLMKLDG